MCGCYLPDTNGDVGGTWYVEWVNPHFAIYDKNTGAQLQAPRPGNQLFTGLPVCGTVNSGDPVTIYDQYAGRSLLASSARPGRLRTTSASPSRLRRRAGTWCAYEFNVHNTKFNDYPKMGVWPTQNAYTMTANQFPPRASEAWASGRSSAIR